MRAYVTVPGITLGDETKWEPLIEHLEREAHDVGPILSFNAAGAELVMSFDVGDQAAAAARAVSVVTDALHATGLGEHHVAAVELEAITADELAPA